MCSVSSGNDEIVLSTSTSQLGPFCPPRNIWQYLGTFLVVTLGKWYWHQWIKISQGATHPTMHKTVPPKRIIWPKMSTVMTLRTCLRLDLPVRKNCTNILKLSLKKTKSYLGSKGLPDQSLEKGKKVDRLASGVIVNF